MFNNSNAYLDTQSTVSKQHTSKSSASYE